MSTFTFDQAFEVARRHFAHNRHIRDAFPPSKTVKMTIEIDGGQPISMTWGVQGLNDVMPKRLNRTFTDKIEAETFCASVNGEVAETVNPNAGNGSGAPTYWVRWTEPSTDRHATSGANLSGIKLTANDGGAM